MSDNNHTEIRKLLDALAEMRAALDVLALDYQEKRKVVLAPVQEDLDALAAEFDPLLLAAEERVAEVEARVKAEVLQAGESVKGEHVQAVYMGGRVTWDDKALQGFAAANPKILNWRKVGQPSVTLRTVK